MAHYDEHDEHYQCHDDQDNHGDHGGVHSPVILITGREGAALNQN